MLKLDRLPEGIDPNDVAKWLFKCEKCNAFIPTWEAKWETKKETEESVAMVRCPKCDSVLTHLNQIFPSLIQHEVKTPPLHTMKALLLQALLGSNLDPLIQALGKVAFKVDLLTSEMKTRNKIEEAKITYNKALNEARAGIKLALKKKEKERKDGAKEG